MAFEAERKGVPIVRISDLSREISPLQDVAAAVRLANLIRTLRPDVLHTHTAKACAVGRLAAALAGSAPPRVVVFTFHGHVLTGYFARAGTAFFRVVETALARTSDALVALSPQVRDDLVAIGAAPATRFAVVRLGIDLEPRVRDGREPAESRRLLGITPERLVVAWFGRMTAVKRIDDLVDVLERVCARGVDACLLLVGDGAEGGALSSAPTTWGLAQDCLCLGY